MPVHFPLLSHCSRHTLSSAGCSVSPGGASGVGRSVLSGRFSWAGKRNLLEAAGTWDVSCLGDCMLTGLSRGGGQVTPRQAPENRVRKVSF